MIWSTISAAITKYEKEKGVVPDSIIVSRKIHKVLTDTAEGASRFYGEEKTLTMHVSALLSENSFVLFNGGLEFKCSDSLINY